MFASTPVPPLRLPSPTAPLQTRVATQACDADVKRLCSVSSTSSRPAPGAVRDCLAPHLAAARQAEGEAAGQAGSTPGYAGPGGVAAAAQGAGSVRRLAGLFAGSAAAQELAAASGGLAHSEASWRRKQQEADGGQAAVADDDDEAQPAGDAAQVVTAHGGGSGEQGLAPECRAFLEVALPADAFERFQDSMTATGVLTQLAAIESRLGLPHGSLHNPGEPGPACRPVLRAVPAVLCMLLPKGRCGNRPSGHPRRGAGREVAGWGNARVRQGQ